MGLDFISFHTPKGVGRPILAFVSYFEQFYPLSSGLGGGSEKGVGRKWIYFCDIFGAKARLRFQSPVCEGAICNPTWPINTHLTVQERLPVLKARVFLLQRVWIQQEQLLHFPLRMLLMACQTKKSRRFAAGEGCFPWGLVLKK